MKEIRKRLTYANVMSSIAVFFILGGATAIAAKKIGTKQLKANSVTTGKIKKNAVTTAKIKNNAVNGAKVNESTLGEVPSAANAGNADTVNGQRIFKVNYRANAGSAAATIFNAQGLTISAACGAANTISVTAATSKEDSSIYSFVGGDVVPAPNNPFEDDLEGGGFDVGDSFSLLAGGDGDINFVHFEFDALDGTIATGTLAVDENGEDNGCLATGHVIIG